MHQKIIIYIILLFSTGLIAQQPTQTIRGTIIDESSNLPLPFVSIGIQNSTSDTFSDSLGNFILHNVGIGRYNIVAALLGYEPVIIKEIQVTSAKEVVLNITMKEKNREFQFIDVYDRWVFKGSENDAYAGYIWISVKIGEIVKFNQLQ